MNPDVFHTCYSCMLHTDRQSEARLMCNTMQLQLLYLMSLRKTTECCGKHGINLSIFINDRQWDWVHPQQVYRQHQAEWCSLLVRRKGCHPEGSWQAQRVGPCEPHGFQQAQAQGPANGLGPSTVSVHRLEDEWIERLPREAVDAPPWQCSRPGWMGLWATWSGGRCPCPWQGGWN